jgi:hypothetical protein
MNESGENDPNIPQSLMLLMPTPQSAYIKCDSVLLLVE